MPCPCLFKESELNFAGHSKSEGADRNFPEELRFQMGCGACN